MRVVKHLKTFSVAILSLFILQVVATPASAALQATEPTVRSSVLLVLQGENDISPGSEGKHDFYALRIISYDLPYTASRVYTQVPSSARDISVWSGSVSFNQSLYGRESIGPYAGQFYIDVPSSHQRTAGFMNASSSEADFNANGSVFSNTNYSSGALRLVNDSAYGTFISADISVPDSINVVSATLTINGNSTGNITSYLSNDGGTSWDKCVNSTSLPFKTSGNTLKVLFDMTGNETIGNDTSVKSFQLAATYTAVSTIFTIHVSYLWTAEFSHGAAVIDLSEAMPFSDNGTFLVMIYTITGYSASSSALQLIFDENRTMNSYAGKDLYLNTSYPSGSVAYSVEITAPASKVNIGLYAAAIVLVVAFAAAIAFGLMRREMPRPSPKAQLSASQVAPELSADEKDKRKSLVEKKKTMLKEVADIRSKLSSGEISQVAANEELARIKKEFKKVRNELNRLSRKTETSAPVETSSSDKESVLAALARIDEDYEKGRLPEGTYRNVRKEYVQRAAEIMVAEGSSAEGGQSPADLEKDMLMEAIVVLDEERQRGEIDEKVYSDLGASYRKQLSELMKKSENHEE